MLIAFHLMPEKCCGKTNYYINDKPDNSFFCFCSHVLKICFDLLLPPVVFTNASVILFFVFVNAVDIICIAATAFHSIISCVALFNAFSIMS